MIYEINTEEENNNMIIYMFVKILKSYEVTYIKIKIYTIKINE